ncbi:DHH family phosphoesterase [Candidatus Woesearchaeota archaeon]|nr:DHH family phosphoesterase [Candidatus Woesearchaeota archaeon]
MEHYSFSEQLDRAVDFFNSIGRDETIKIVSHLDADGICAGSIMIAALNRLGRKYAISIVPQLQEKLISELASERYNAYIFTDLGSGQIGPISSMMRGSKVLVLDHHGIKDKRALQEEDVMHVNPHLAGLDGSTEISGAGVVFEFARRLDKENTDLAHLAVIGAIGDCQENRGFKGYNSQILKTAEMMGVIRTHKGLCVFGSQSKPLHKLLEYSFEPYIPGVSGSESGAVEFLRSININPKQGNSWKKLVHLTEKEMERLVAGIVMRRKNEDKPDDVIGNIYILPGEDEGPLRDAREFSTLLNSCGRMGKASIGIGACLGDQKMKRKAIKSLVDYRRELVSALRWFDANKNAKDITIDKGFMIINAKYSILPTMIGTVASIISRSNEIKEGTIVMAMARLEQKQTKISFRMAGRDRDGCPDLRAVAAKVAGHVNGQSGGHVNAAGAIIDTSREEESIMFSLQLLSSLAMEEKIVS